MQKDRSTTDRATGRDLIPWGVLLAVLLGLWAIVGYDLYAQRQQLLRIERERMAHQVRLAEENLAGQLRLTGRALDGIRNDLAWFQAHPQPDGKQLVNSRLAALNGAMQGVRTLMVIDVDGNCTASNRPELIGQNFRNGERYRTISQGNDPQMLYLSAPFLTPLKTWAMSAGRVIQDGQGRFNGYVLAILDPEYFNLLMRSVLFAPDMRAAVIHWDGLVVQRVPDPEKLIGVDLSQNPRSLFAQYKVASAPAPGLFEGPSGATGSELLGMLRVVRPTDVAVDKPLLFGVTRDQAAILAPWHSELQARLAGLGTVSLAAVAVLLLFQRRQLAFRRVEAAQADALAERQDQINTFIEHAPASLALLDRKMRYVLASRQWLADFGIEAGQSVAGRDCFELSADLPVRWRTVFERAFAGEVVQFDEDFRQRADGTPQWFNWEVRPCRVKAGVVETIAVFAEDVSRQRHEAQRLRESEQRWRFAIDGSELGLWDWDVKAGTVFFSRRWKTMLGHEPDEVGNDLTEWSKRVHPDDMPQVMADLQPVLSGEAEFYSNEHRVLCKDGSWKWILDRGTVVRRDDDGQPLRAIGTHTDLTELKAREARLELNAGVFSHTAEAIVICGPDNEIQTVNEAFTRITGYSAEEVRGRNPRLLASGRHDRAYYREMWDHIEREGCWQGEIWNRRRNGDLFVAWLTINVDRAEDGSVRHYYTVFSDLTQRRQTEERLLQLTHYDALTDLPNRTLLKERLALAVVQARRDGQGFAVMVLDLDRFKNVNDSLGHGVGDRLLVEVAHRLQRTVGHQDTVARLGGDEFAVVLSQVDADGAAHAAQAIRQALGLPVTLDDHDLVVTPSIGIAVFPGDGEDAQVLLQAADTAMFRAKAEGGHTFRFHTVEMHQKVSRLLELENGLRAAVEEGQLLLHYQPQLAVDGLAVVACEALVRWQHPRLGLIAPGEFIPIAEESGQIVHLGDWVMRTAAAQAKAWQDAGLPPFVMAVNVSQVQFAQPDFVEQVAQVLADTGLAPRWLEIELTESVVAHDPERVVHTIERLHALGIQLSIDDFGTGYSSLGYLRRFRIHKLKVDQSFVREVVEDANSASIVRAIISMARDLGLETLAEGVETEAQFDWLQGAGCEQVQGFRFARPMPASALAQWLGERVGALKA